MKFITYPLYKTRLMSGIHSPTPVMPSHLTFLLSAILLLFAVFVNGAPPVKDYHIIWASDFDAPLSTQWNYFTDKPANNEVEIYTTSTKNAYLTGDGTLVIAPTREPGFWASARLESQQSWGCEDGKKMVLQAELKLGSNLAGQKGMWPAFWAKGVSQ